MTNLDSRADEFRWSVPESITHLYYAPVYQTLTEKERRAYNKLHACFCCEMLVFFEEELPPCYSTAARGVGVSKSVYGEIQAMLASESRHAAMFRDLARDLDSNLYEPFAYHFLRMPKGIWRLLKLPLLSNGRCAACAPGHRSDVESERFLRATSFQLSWYSLAWQVIITPVS